MEVNRQPKQWTWIIAIAASVAVSANSCVDEEGSLFDPNTPPGQVASISSVAPAAGLAGVTNIVISGSNFLADPSKNIVYFDGTPATILQASSTQLTVKAPDLVKDSILVRIAVRGVDMLSNGVYYDLDPAVVEYAPLVHDPASPEEAWAIELDDTGNLYFSLTTGGLASGTKKYSSETGRSDFAPAGGILKWQSFKFLNGVLYAARIAPFIYEIPPGGNPISWVSGSGLGRIYDFDIDATGNMWCGGNNTSVYRITPSKNVKAFAFRANVRGVRVFNGYVYFGGGRDSTEKVWRFEIISSDSLGPVEEYFDFSAIYGVNGPTVNAITFSSDGDLYIGTSGSVGILVVHPDKTYEPLYPGLVPTPIIAMAWDPAEFLFVTRQKSGASVPSAIFKINMQKAGAPHYGR